jgi:hypothetical protein
VFLTLLLRLLLPDLSSRGGPEDSLHHAFWVLQHLNVIRLKNAGATYQRAIQTCLADHWGKRVEAYIDDVVIKTKDPENFIDDLQQVFNSLRRYHYKLKPDKCMFRVPVGKLLDFIISYRGIEANPKKIDAILRMEPPRSYKKVQNLGVLIMQSYPNISSNFVGFRLGTGPDPL